MSSKSIFVLAIITTILGLGMVFWEVPVLEEYPPFNMGFFQGFLMGLGPTLFATAYVRRNKEQENTGHKTAKTHRF